MFGLSPLTLLKLGGFAAGAIAIFAFVVYFQHLRAEAAKVPALQATITQQNDRADKLATKMAAVDAARSASDKALSDWQNDVKTPILEAIRKAGKNAVASTNPVCRPSPDDRKLRNDSWSALLGAGQGGKATPVPAASGPSH